MIYWTLCLYLHNTVRLAFRDFPPGSLSLSAQILRLYDPNPFARRIASTPYFFRPSAGASAPTTFSFAMGTALRYFTHSENDRTSEY